MKTERIHPEAGRSESGSPETASSAVSMATLRWQCRRGMLELDLLLNTFLERCYVNLHADERAVFEKLIQYPDQTLYELLLGKMVSADAQIAGMVDRVRHATMSVA